MNNRWRYAGKEEQRFGPAGAFSPAANAPFSGSGSLDLSLIDFGARMYDPFIVRWTAVDPLADKYLNNTPFCYCIGSPILLFDTNGAEITFWHFVVNEKMSNGGSWELGASSRIKTAVENFAKTKEGFNFLSMFARAGDTIGSITFTADGEYADYSLCFHEYSMANGIAGSFGIIKNHDSPQFYIRLNTHYGDEVDQTLTIGHEAFIHMDRDYLGMIYAHRLSVVMDNNAILKKALNDYRSNLTSEDDDHNFYLNHIQTSRFSLFVNQLKLIFNPTVVDNARLKHDKGIRNLGSKTH